MTTSAIMNTEGLKGRTRGRKKGRKIGRKVRALLRERGHRAYLTQQDTAGKVRQVRSSSRVPLCI